MTVADRRTEGPASQLGGDSGREYNGFGSLHPRRGAVVLNLKKSIVGTVDNAALKDINDVAGRLAAKGMSIDRVPPSTGVITGTCGQARNSALRNVGRVSNVEEEVVAHLPPPDVPVR